MKSLFTIRPTPKNGEALSSYLFKVAESNFISLRELLYYFRYENTRISSSYLYSIDTNPVKYIDLVALAQHLKLSQCTLKKMTYSSVVSKFSSSDKFHSSKLSHFSKVVETKSRKFCRSCLKQNGSYKLIWQVKDIKMCNLHHTLLENTCNSCSKELPYINNHLYNFKCVYCNTLLYRQSDERVYLNNEEAQRQMMLYKNWRTLMDENHVLIKEPKLESLEKSLALVFIYIISKKRESIFLNKENRIDDNLSSSYLRVLKSFLKTKNNKTQSKITIFKLLWLIEEYNISLEELSNINIPQEFISKILYPEKIKLGPCLTKWCVSYHSRRNIKKINMAKPNLKGGDFTQTSICLDCFVKYAHNKKTGDWEAIKLFKQQIVGVNPALIDTILSLINEGVTVNELLNCNIVKRRYTLLYSICYLINQSILPESYLFKQKVIIPENIVDAFQELIKRKGNMRKNAITLYKWKTNEFYYYLTIPQIQRYIIENYTKIRKLSKSTSSLFWETKVKEVIEEMLVSGEVISVKSIKKKLNVSSSIIYTYNLSQVIINAKEKQRRKELRKLEVHYKKILDQWLLRKRNEDNIILRKEAYKKIKKQEDWIRINLPTLKNWLKAEIEKYNKVIKRRKLEKLKISIADIIAEMKSCGEEMGYEDILSKLGYGRYIFRNYPELRIYINSLR